MNRIIATVVVAAALLCQAFAQADPVVMTINGKQITRSEFEYSYNKNNSEGVIDKKGVEDYAQLFIDFKLKVAAAEEARYDTLSSMQKDLYEYREGTLLASLVDNDFIEREARATYDATAARFGGEDIMTASHILVMLRQTATDEQQAAAKVRIDSIYNALKAGADFAELAKKCSDDTGSAQRGGQLGQFGKGMMIPDFEKAAFALKAGEMSEPFLSTVGWHIILMHERHPFEPYEHHRESILRYLDQRGIREASANHLVDSLARQRGVERNVVVEEMFNELAAGDPDLRYLAQEFYDGSMMFEISNKLIWEPTKKDEAGLAAYFAKHKKLYAWDAPRFKGIVINTKTREQAELAKKLIKKEKDDTKWGQMIVSELNNDSVKVVRITHGLFKQGMSPNVDVMVFGADKELQPLKDYPVTDVYGRLLKKPEGYKDVQDQVVNDYQAEQEKAWVAGLRKKFSYSINEDVLKTVNNH